MKCPLYGIQLAIVGAPTGHREVVVLATAGSNQCPLVMPAFSPCRMEIEGRDPDWKACPRNPDNYEKPRAAAPIGGVQ